MLAILLHFFANLLFMFIRVWTLDSVHARLRLPFLTLQEKRIYIDSDVSMRSQVVKTVTSVYIHSSEKSCTKRDAWFRFAFSPSLFKLYEVWSVDSAENH